ncbi:MAG: hypothetical protein EON88_09800, partial [Brevundimonas sp.]
VERIAAAVEAAGFTCQVIDHSALSSAAEWFSRVEDSHDFVLYVAEADEPAWAALCARQVDRVFVVGQCLLAPPNRPLPHAGVLDAQRRTDLILLRDPRMARPHNTSVWIDAVQPGRWFQAQEGDQADADRLARVITGTAVGVVMSGGGARAYSHIGALRALRDAGVPIDFVGGSSMGAVVAAGPAMGWSLEELEDRIRKSFVDSDPLSDITFPMLAMTRANKVERLLEQAYGDTDMADLSRPFFAVSTNLTAGRIEVHRRGLMRRAMRASIAIPGLLPPVVIDGQVLVDGAVLNNLPAEVMRQMNSGPVIGIDMSQARGVDPALIQHPPSIWRLLATGAWRRGPPIVSIMMRSATLTSDAEIERSRAIVDILIQPTPDGVDIRDWKAYGPAVDAGYRAMQAELETLDGPVTGLRRRRSAPRNQKQTRKRQKRHPVRPTRERLRKRVGKRRKISVPHSRIILQRRQMRSQRRPLHPLQHRIRPGQGVQIGRGPDIHVLAGFGQHAVVGVGAQQGLDRLPVAQPVRPWPLRHDGAHGLVMQRIPRQRHLDRDHAVGRQQPRQPPQQPLMIRQPLQRSVGEDQVHGRVRHPRRQIRLHPLHIRTRRPRLLQHGRAGIQPDHSRARMPPFQQRRVLPRPAAQIHDQARLQIAGQPQQQIQRGPIPLGLEPAVLMGVPGGRQVAHGGELSRQGAALGK